jgi:response regulator of citrate/malate metabolism
MMTGRSVLLVDDSKSLIELFKCYATKSDSISLSCASSLDEALDHIAKDRPEAILLDNRLTPYNDFSETVPVLREFGYDGKIVIISCDVNDEIFLDHKNYSVSCCIDKFEINYSNFESVMEGFIA